MTIAIAIFAKNPDLSPVKTRLAQDIGKEKAILFYQLCLQCIRELIQELVSASPLGITPYWALAEQESLLLPQWQCFNTLWTGEGDLGERLHHVYSSLLGKHEGVIILGSDSPALTLSLLNAAITAMQLDRKSVILGPARDGGFYLLGGQCSIEKSIWLNTSYSRDDTLEILGEELQHYNIPVTLLPEHFDVDTENDLLALQGYLQEHDLISDTQHKILQFIDSL